MAIGPTPPPLPPATRHYVTHVRTGGTQWSAFSDNPTNPSSWVDDRIEPTTPTPPHYLGRGGAPEVLTNGRLVVTARDMIGGDFGGWYNANLPTLVYSDNGGTQWLPGGTQLVRIADFELSGIQAVKIGGTDPLEVGDTPWHIDRRSCFPSIGIDRATSPNTIYVAFYARRTPDPPSGDGNADIYIARSFTDDVTGVISFPNESTIPPIFLFQLTDERLGLPAPPTNSTGPDQLMPAVAVDSCGNVHVVYYDTRNPDGLPIPNPNPDNLTWVDVYYVLITGFSSGNPTVAYQKRLTPTSFVVGPDLGVFPFLGDYHHIANAGPGPRGPTLYCAYIVSAQDSSADPWNRRKCFLHKISPICSSDFNLSGGAEGEDIGLFYDAYSAWNEASDLNGDGSIDYVDEELFWDTYDHMLTSP